MKTKCYCVGCKKHPLHNQRQNLKWLVGYDIGDIIYAEYKESGANVECLNPGGTAVDELGIDPEDFEYPVTAYSDGCNITGFDKWVYLVRLSCLDEEFEN